jgi:F-type H+-transporting ATPase subunit epsilon
MGPPCLGINMSSFNVNILTPTSELAKGLSAESLIIPTVQGEITVLPEHTHLISVLDTGVLTLVNGKESKKFVITTGTLKVLNSDITILAQVAEYEGDIDISRAQRALQKSEDALGKCKSEAEIIKYQRKIARARLRIELAKNFK